MWRLLPFPASIKRTLITSLQQRTEAIPKSSMSGILCNFDRRQELVSVENLLDHDQSAVDKLQQACGLNTEWALLRDMITLKPGIVKSSSIDYSPWVGGQVTVCLALGNQAAELILPGKNVGFSRDQKVQLPLDQILLLSQRTRFHSSTPLYLATFVYDSQFREMVWSRYGYVAYTEAQSYFYVKSIQDS